MPSFTRMEAIKAEVYARNHIWEAYDQGRYAYAAGNDRAANPHGPYYPGYFHMNMADWLRGWDAEAARDQEDAAADVDHHYTLAGAHAAGGR